MLVKKNEGIRDRILTKEEIDLLLTTIAPNQMQHSILYFLSRTGCRPASAFKLKVSDITPSHINFASIKKSKAYKFPLNAKLKEHLTTHININNLGKEDFLFCEDENKSIPMRYHHFYTEIIETFNTLFNANYNSSDRIHRATPYTLRHSFATFLVNGKNTNVFDAKELLNHSDLKITERYYKKNEDRVIEELETMYEEK